VFIDNSKDNVIAPAALGTKTVFHDDERNDLMALSEALESMACSRAMPDTSINAACPVKLRHAG